MSDFTKLTIPKKLGAKTIEFEDITPPIVCPLIFENKEWSMFLVFYKSIKTGDLNFLVQASEQTAALFKEGKINFLELTQKSKVSMVAREYMSYGVLEIITENYDMASDKDTAMFGFNFYIA